MRRLAIRLPPSEEGFSIVEVLVAMLMLALLAVSFLPVLVTGLRLTANNSSITTAAQLVQEQLTLARSQGATCTALSSFRVAAAASVVDGAGKTLVVAKALTCPSTYPGSATFTATVTASGSSTTIASATTLIYVSTS